MLSILQPIRLSKISKKNKRENLHIIRFINYSDHLFIFFRQRNTVGFKLKILLEPLSGFQPQKVVYISRQRQKYLTNARASSNDKEPGQFLA